MLSRVLVEGRAVCTYLILICICSTTVSFSPTARSLTVTVTSNSTMYHVAISVTLTCHVGLEAIQPVTYSWSSSCSGQCSVAGQTGNTVTISLLRSIDSGTYTCTVTDHVGNYPC